MALRGVQSLLGAILPLPPLPRSVLRGRARVPPSLNHSCVAS